MALPRQPYISVEDYLTLDRSSQDVRFEYYDGELVMLAGGSGYHSAIKVNLISILQRLLKKSPCRVYDSDMRVQLSKTRYVYPDATVTCDRRDDPAHDTIQYPRIVFEVLSPGTEAKDRGKKFILYRECSAIEEYVMVDSQRVQVEVYHRDGGRWTLKTYTAEDEILLESLAIRFTVAEVYEGLDLEECHQ